MDRSFLSYQFVGTTNSLHETRSPNHIKKITNILGVDKKERHLIEQFLPSLKDLSGARLKSTSRDASTNPIKLVDIGSQRRNKSQNQYISSTNNSPKNLEYIPSRQQKITELRKKISDLTQIQEILIHQVQSQLNVPDDFFYIGQEGGSAFEDYFRQLPNQFQLQKDKLRQIQTKISQLKQQLFMVENTKSNKSKLKFFYSPLNSENQKIQLSSLATELPKISDVMHTKKFGKKRILNRLRIPKPIFDGKKKLTDNEDYSPATKRTIFELPSYDNSFRILMNDTLPLHDYLPDEQLVANEFSDYGLRNPQKRLRKQPKLNDDDSLFDVDLILESEEDDLRVNTITSRQNINDFIQKPPSNSYSQLQNSKQSLQQHRFFKYNQLYTQFYHLKNFEVQNKRGKITFKCAVNVVLFSMKLIIQTGQSLYVYQQLASAHHKEYFPVCNDDCLQFVNQTLIKQIFCSPKRIAIFQRLHNQTPQSRIIQLQTCMECVQEIYQRLLNSTFTSKLYKFLKCISNQSFYSLNNFHSVYTQKQLTYSQFFGYLDKQGSKQKRLIIFEFVVIKNIIYYGLFFKLEEMFEQLKIEAEIVSMVVSILLYLFMPDVKNYLHLINKKFDGQYSYDHMKQLIKLQPSIINELKEQDGLNINLNELRLIQDEWLNKVLKHID